ncbi:MAG: hypothetical protein WA061_01880 [Microgenomates group bacterium]
MNTYIIKELDVENVRFPIIAEGYFDAIKIFCKSKYYRKSIWYIYDLEIYDGGKIEIITRITEF